MHYLEKKKRGKKMNTELVHAIYTERKRTYHILTAIMHMAQSEVFISKKFKQFILDAQQESENEYLRISHDMFEQGFREENE